MIFFGKPQSYLGVDLGAGGVKMVELKREKDRPVLFTYGLTSGTQNVHQLLTRSEGAISPQEIGSREGGTAVKQAILKEQFTIDDSQVKRYAELIQLVAKEIRAQAKVAVASLPVSAVFHAVVTMPMVKKEDFNNILNAEIKKLLPYPMEEMAVQPQVLPGAPEARAQRVLVNAVPRALVAFYSKVFQRAGLKLDSLEPESEALSRALIGRDASTTMLIDVGAERTNFFIVDQTVPLTHHSIELGGERINRLLQQTLGVEEGAVERLKRDVFDYIGTPGVSIPLSKEQFLGQFMPVIEPVTKEMAYSLDLFLRQSGNETKRLEKVVLTGGAAHFPYLAGYIADKFKVKCYIGDPWGRVVYQDNLKPILRDIGPRMAVAIGLALRNVV